MILNGATIANRGREDQTLRSSKPTDLMTDTSPSQPDLMLYCPASFGGIPDYAHHQAEAIGDAGWNVLMLCPPDYPHKPTRYRQEKCLPGGKPRARTKLVRIARLVRQILGGYSTLARRVSETGTHRVLLASYSEYLAPLWAWRMRRLQRHGVCFGAVVHDPVRDFIVGPHWWHRRSVSEGYSFLSHAFVHEAIQLDTGRPQRQVPTTVIPHGPYPFPDPREPRSSTRAALRIPDDVPLFLSFGHLRDGKNLNLILTAMVEVPSAWLLIAGTEAGTGHTKSAELMHLAEQLGVAERCRWNIGFLSPDDAANLFQAADHVLLTYEKRFRSASGVMNVAARYRKSVVASCGPGNLATTVKAYGLGPWVEPDRAEEIARGMLAILENSPETEWERYAEDNSWQRNAALVMAAFGA